MARSIKTIQEEMVTAVEHGTLDPQTAGVMTASEQSELTEAVARRGGTLSRSGVSEWKLWTYVVAGVIHTFEVILDLFRKEINEVTAKISPGSERWYAEMCRRFQNGHELLFDPRTASLYYAKEDPDARIIRVVAVKTREDQIALKVAKLSSDNQIVPLSEEELSNFKAYIEGVKFAGDRVEPAPTTADEVEYDLEVFYNPLVSESRIRQELQQTLSDFRLQLDFNSMFYPQRMLDAILGVDGVITARLNNIRSKGATDTDFEAIDVMRELESGYFEYSPDSLLTLTPVK